MSESDYVISPMGQAVSKAVSSQNKLKDSVADTLDATYNFGYEVGASEAKENIIKQLIDQNVIRIDVFGRPVFVNCNTLEVQYLKDFSIKEEKTNEK